jgi:hypothetical protein
MATISQSSAITSFPRPQAQISASLAGTYVAWILIMAALYPACRWYAGVKQRRRDWWLSYL